MAQQTAMQEMIKWATSLKDKEQQCIDWIVIKTKAEELFEIEKEQIMQSYIEGAEEAKKIFKEELQEFIVLPKDFTYKK